MERNVDVRSSEGASGSYRIIEQDLERTGMD
jgi:hypothetical protein